MLKYGTFCREKLKYALWAEENGINCAASWLRILISPDEEMLCLDEIHTKNGQNEESIVYSWEAIAKWRKDYGICKYQNGS